MEQQDQSAARFPRMAQMLLSMAALVIVLAGIREASSLVGTFVFALVLTICLAPIPAKLSSKGLPMWLAFTITALGALLVLLILVAILGGALVQFAGSLPKYSDRFEGVRQSAEDLASRFGVDLADIDIGGLLDPAKVSAFMLSVVNAILGALSSTALLLAMLLFLMLDAVGFAPKAEHVFALRPRVYEGWRRYVRDTRKYMFMASWTGLLAGSLNTGLLLALGVDFALLWGILSFLFGFVPNVGFMLSVIPPAMLALLEFGWTRMLIVVAGFVIVNSLIDNVLKPMVIGDFLNLSLATTFISLVVWGFVLGPTGALLATPLTLFVARVVLETGDDTQWLSAMLMRRLPDDATPEPEPQPEPEPA